MGDFNPHDHLRRLRGKGGDADYLDVKWRIVWLRHEHPDASIRTEKMAGGMEANYAEFMAWVSFPGGGSATGYGSESKADFGDFIEKAETKALGRAIAALGYGTQFVGNELDEGERIVDSPVERKRSRREGMDEHDEHARQGPAGPPDDLAIMGDPAARPEARKAALHRHYSGAETPAELNARAEDVYSTGMDADVLASAYRWHHDRLSKQLAPAGVAG